MSFAFGGIGAAVAAVLAAGAVWGSLHLIGRRTEELQHERQMYVRGAMGEQLVGWMLEDLNDDWHVFHGIQLQDGQDLDHVVVGPGGLFYIQTKNVRGLFSVGPDGQPLHNNSLTPLLSQTLGQAMNLKERLTALLGSSAVWTNAVLAVPFAHIEGKGQMRNVLVLNHADLSGRLESMPKRLSTLRGELERTVTDARGQQK